ncbi:hypothetical protein DS66_00165 [Mesotoga sp. SC_3PWM13N19]|nr:hypothetical protein DS66_00165 [Mesotoga sp. SC_3PWM13N19]
MTVNVVFHQRKAVHIKNGQTPFFTLNEKSKAKNCEGLLIHKKKKRSLFPATPTKTPPCREITPWLFWQTRVFSLHYL